MQYVFLIMYLWHQDGVTNSSHGGPALTIAPMPSLEVCEQVGKLAKDVADQQAPVGWFTSNSQPAVYRCVQVAQPAQRPR